MSDEHDDALCQKCECPFLTSMQHRPTGRWAARCGNCGYTFWLDGDRSEVKSAD